MADSEPTIALDVNEILSESPEAEQTTATSEPSAEETNEATEDQAAGDTESTDAQETDGDAGEASDEESDDKDDTDTEDDTADTEDTEGTDPKGGKMDAATRREQLQVEIRQLANRKTQLLQEIAVANSKFYKASTPEEIMAADPEIDPAMARVQALEEQRQMDQYNQYVTDLNTSLDIDSNQVLLDNPIFDEKSTEYAPHLADLARQTYVEVAQVKTDPNTGAVVQASVMPSTVYKAIADAYKAGSQAGKVSGRKAATKTLAATETPSASAPTRTKEDPFLAGLRRGL